MFLSAQQHGPFQGASLSLKSKPYTTGARATPCFPKSKLHTVIVVASTVCQQKSDKTTLAISLFAILEFGLCGEGSLGLTDVYDELPRPKHPQPPRVQNFTSDTTGESE